MATYEDFEKLDIRVGRITKAEDLPNARKPSYIVEANFGEEVGEKRSCAQLTENYTKEELIGMLILGAINFPPKQIGKVASEFLLLGVPDAAGRCVIVTPDQGAVVGGRLY
jgi:tRNA-binding protein